MRPQSAIGGPSQRMHVLLRGGCSFVVAASLAAAGTASRADELLVMPYSCSVSGGEPVLIPSSDKGYRIIGGREQRDFTACSPADPANCRNWKVHRFDVDCSGTRVPWASVVAAADRHRRAWIEGGRLRVRVPWTWALPQGDPCARLSEFDRRRPRYRRLARRCAFREARAPDSVVEMPHGFAPKLDIDAIFVAGAPRQVQSFSATKPAAPGPKVAAEEMRIETPPVPPRADRSQRNAATVSNSAGAASAESRSLRASPPAEAKTASPAAGSPAAPTIINRQGADTPRTSPQASITPDSYDTGTVAVAQTKAPSNDGDASVLPPSPPAENQQTKQALQNQSEARASAVVGYLTDPMTVAVSVLTLLSTIVIAGFMLMRRHDASRARVATSRDIASVWLDETRGSAEESSALAAAKVIEARPEQSAPARIATSTWGDTIPQNRDDALRVLGLGGSSEANQTAIKKIVDGLRMSWHPDHAEGENDRNIRELRLKQINAAWEIMSGELAKEHA